MSYRCHLANNFDDTFCCHYVPEPPPEHSPDPDPATKLPLVADMSRPQSMPDFTTLMDSSLPLFEQSTSSHFEKRIHSRRQTSPERKAHHARMKPSISLAAGLMMNTDTPLATGPISPRKRSQSRPAEERRVEVDEDATLFYAYAQRSDYPSSPPYVLTFASAAICSQWWNLVQQEYPMSARPSPQFFIVRSEDMELIQDDPKFFSLRNKWFYSSQDSPTCPPIVLPLQYANGAPAVSPPPPAASTPALDSLAESLARLSSVVESNAEQVHALSVAQSTGLQAMQEINESNSIQIKAISESQIKLQALVDQNASHYIALSNTSFQSQESTRQAQERTLKAQEQTKDILDKTVAQLASLAKAQADLSQTCQSMIQSLDAFTHNTAVSDTASTHSLATPSTTTMVREASASALASRISPPPRKLNRRIKGVWYEYDCAPGSAGTTTAASSTAGTPRKRADSASVQTPPKSPVALKAS